MPFLLLLALIVLAVIIALSFIARSWLPLLGAAAGRSFDHQLHLTLLVFGIAFLLVQFVLAIFVWKFRGSRNSSHGSRARGWLALEIGAMIFTGAVFLALGIKGGALTAFSQMAPQANALQVEVTGMQFQWYYRYPGADGKFGVSRPELVDASIGNPLGLDRSDPAAKDDIVAAQLVVPVNRPVELTLKSQDVVHSFLVPAMRLQMNVVPGLITHIAFTPTRTGTYEIVCNQLCGLGHYRMHSAMIVLGPEQFEKWMEQRSQRQ